MSMSTHATEAGFVRPIRPMPPVPTTEATEAPTRPDGRTPASGPAEHRPGKRHVQQSLHHLQRVVRHAVRDAVGRRGADDEKMAVESRDLIHDFRDDLRAAFVTAGEDGEFDHAGMLSAVAEALADLSEHLRELSTAAGEDRTGEVLPVPEPEGLPEIQDAPEPGGLVSTSA
ncbi:hypothetical protein GF314_05955 [bacterium]|nr:hypothetical protein [bacterium]